MASAGHSAARRTIPGPSRRHVVQAGESLWSIAATALDTDDPRRVARYWPRIHRLNRSTIGADPSVIHPGQILELPEVD